MLVIAYPASTPCRGRAVRVWIGKTSLKIRVPAWPDHGASENLDAAMLGASSKPVGHAYGLLATRAGLRGDRCIGFAAAISTAPGWERRRVGG